MNQLRKLYASLSIRQRISLAAVAFLVGGALFAFTKWNTERGFKPLYSSLSAEDAGAVVQKLRESGVEFRLDDITNTIRVPSEKVAELRLQMATAGLPKTGRIGYELFDKTNFGVTDFAEHINYQRALEAELERSIISLAEVQQARVHINFSKDSVFLESRRPAKASVLLGLRPGAQVSAQSVSGICYLVSSAVEGLAPEAVTVLDMRGNLLARPRKASADGIVELADADLEYRQKIERDLVGKIQETLEPLLGAGRFRAGATVECDFTSGDQSEESFDPARSVMVSSQKSEDASGAQQTAGVPGTASNLPRPAVRGPGGGTGATRKTENVSYQTSRTVRRVQLVPGSIKRMSLAILVDQEVRFEGVGPKAKRIVEPPSQEKIKVIKDLVAAATGFSPGRGDQLTVESLPFESTLRTEPPLAPRTPTPLSDGSWFRVPAIALKIPPRIWIGLGIGLAVLACAVFFLLRKLKKKVRVHSPRALGEGEGEEAREMLGGHARTEPNYEGKLAEHEAEQARLEAEALKALELPPATTNKAEVLAKYIRASAHKNAEGPAQLIRSWIHDKER